MRKEQDIIMGLWLQFSFPSGSLDRQQCYCSGGLSSLEDAEEYLLEHGLIDENGLPVIK